MEGLEETVSFSIWSNWSFTAAVEMAVSTIPSTIPPTSMRFSLLSNRLMSFRCKRVESVRRWTTSNRIFSLPVGEGCEIEKRLAASTDRVHIWMTDAARSSLSSRDKALCTSVPLACVLERLRKVCDEEEEGKEEEGKEEEGKEEEKEEEVWEEREE